MTREIEKEETGITATMTNTTTTTTTTKSARRCYTSTVRSRDVQLEDTSAQRIT